MSVKSVGMAFLAAVVCTAAVGIYSAVNGKKINVNHELPQYESDSSAVDSHAGSLEITAAKQDYTYTGKAIVPDCVIKADGAVADKSDYNINVENNVNVGWATVTAVKKDDDSQKASFKFRIVPTVPKISDSFKSTKSSVTIKWSKSEQADYYVILRFDSKKNNWAEIGKTKDGKTLSYTDKKLKGASEYQYAVKGCKDIDGEKFDGTKSKEIHSMTLPDDMKNVKYVEKSDSSDIITWDISEGCKGYEISVINESGEEEFTDTVEMLEYSIPDQYSQGGYEFKVRGYCQLNDKKYYGKYSDSVISPKDKNAFSGKKKIINVNTVMQNPELPTGCEVTALTALVNYFGFNIDKVTMAREYLPKQDFYYKNNVYYGADFRNTFAGNPENQNSYGCYAPCIETTANKYFKAVNADYKAKAYEKGDFDKLITDYIDNDIPVLIWVTSDNLHEPILTDKWKTPDNKEVQWLAYEHCVVLKGYDNGKISVCDSLTGDTLYKYETIKQRFNEMGGQYVVISQENQNGVIMQN